VYRKCTSPSFSIPQLQLYGQVHFPVRLRTTVLLYGVCRLSSSVTLHGGPVGGFTRAGKSMTS